MDRNEALELLKQYVKNDRMINHCLATEVVMAALAKRLGKDETKWALAGLLHDLDSELTNGDLKTHALETEKILKEKGVDPEIVEAIKLHNESAHGIKRSAEFHYALAAGETVTGMIVATTLVYPDKKIASVKTKSVTKRMKEKAFAASVSRENIMECEKLGLTLDEFVEISVNAMRGISEKLGL
ncbi:MAG: hydrolase [Elusimicrobia bacterium RIFOXYB2_FULL_48_7]|nr:MAG: hydrolase [Elusimicrobia bacterium RIFOXYB2_FULL_48_7]